MILSGGAEMDHFRFRGSVKIISYIDMGFSLFVIFLTIMASVSVFVLTFHDQGFQDIVAFLNKKLSRLELGRIFVIIWILSFTFNILQFFAACALLSGTELVEEEDEEDNNNIHKCRFWQLTSTFLFLILVLLAFLSPSPYLIAFCVGEFIFRAVGIYYVNQFIWELEEETNINSSQAQLLYMESQNMGPTELEVPWKNQQF